MFDRVDPALRSIQSHNDGLAESLTLRASIRIPPGLSSAGVQREVEALAPGSARLRFWGADPPYRAEKNTALVRAFLKAVRAERLEPAFKVKSGTSDMNVVGPAWNCPIVAYGPGDSNLDHTPDEHLDLAEYRQAIRVLARVLQSVETPTGHKPRQNRQPTMSNRSTEESLDRFSVVRCSFFIPAATPRRPAYSWLNT
jgi:LysW-gamma-L-lysine carboxypeptidase